MTENDILSMLKIDLQISAPQYDSYLTNLIKLAKAAIIEEGIAINELVKNEGEVATTTETVITVTVEDGMLIQMYAAYLYRKRRGEDKAMPRSLRYALNNRLFSQKGRAT